MYHCGWLRSAEHPICACWPWGCPLCLSRLCPLIRSLSVEASVLDGVAGPHLGFEPERLLLTYHCLELEFPLPFLIPRLSLSCLCVCVCWKFLGFCTCTQPVKNNQFYLSLSGNLPSPVFYFSFARLNGYKTYNRDSLRGFWSPPTPPQQMMSVKEPIGPWIPFIQLTFSCPTSLSI